MAGAAAGIRQRFRFPLAASAKVNLDRGLQAAQESVTASDAASAWMEGWSMPLEKAIEYALACGPTE